MALELAPGVLVAKRYRLQKLLGEGGTADVWAAECETTGARVALKIAKAGEQGARRRTFGEAHAAMLLRHPNVVRVECVLELEDGSQALVMELLEGETLAARLERDKTLAPLETARLMRQVVSAVGLAHERGIVHRDLKPHNMFLLAEKGPGAHLAVKVLDFGIARMTRLEERQQATLGLTTSGILLGTPCYMAPEQITAERDVDGRADTWALGVVFYQCLSGVLPTAGKNLGQILKIVLTRPIWPLRETAPDVPAELAALVDRMLSRDREARPSLEEVFAVLSAHAALPIAAPFDAPAKPVEPHAASEEPVPAPQRRTLGTPRALAVLVLVLVTAAAIAFLARSASPLPPAGRSTPGSSSAQAD